MALKYLDVNRIEMDKKFLIEHNILGSVNRFNQILEYVNTAGMSYMNEDGEDEMPADGGAPENVPMGDGGMDPNQPMDGGNMEQGGQQGPPMDDAVGMEDGSMDMGGEGQGPEGFSPQGEQPQMGATPETDPNSEMEEEDEVIDVDDLTNAQEETEDKIDILGSKFDKVFDMLGKLTGQIEANDKRFEEFKAEMEKRNPTPVEKMTLRSTKSGPFTQTPEEYWKTSAPENYSTEDDENGENMPEYKITKDEIDNFRDWNGISKTFDEYPVSLNDLFGY